VDFLLQLDVPIRIILNLWKCVPWESFK